MKRFLQAVRHPKQLLNLVRGRRDAGMATAEYAVGTVAAISLGGVIIGILTSPKFLDFLWEFLKWLFDWIMTGFGAGA